MLAEASFERLLHFGAPLLDGCAIGAGLVAEVVAVPHESIDGAHGAPLVRGKQQERIVEILGPAPRHPQAVAIRLFEIAHRRPIATVSADRSNSRTRSAFD